MLPFFSVQGHSQGKRCLTRFGGIHKWPAMQYGQHPTQVCAICACAMYFIDMENESATYG